ncbi:MAG: PQQ-binding-like beta-propeller repeat protein [Ardenticatenaceae bacterium]|nr:PQQ-binding-like beta-propeller repeat protein [Ardenticatenaceae bacterium]
MYQAKRPLTRPAILIFILVSFILAACSTSLTTGNWPGLSTDGQKVYVAHGTGVVAYNVADQSVAWTFPEEASRVPIYAAPSVQDGRIIIADFGAPGGFFSPGNVVTIYALNDVDQGTPTTIWSANEATKASIVASPLQVGERIFVGTADNHVVALDATNGTLLWDFEVGNSVWGQPAYKDGTVFVAVLDKKVYAIDAESGQSVWDEPVALEGALASRPVVDTDLVYVTSFDGQLHALSISSGELVWSASGQDWIWGAPTLVDGVVYFVDVQGNVYAVDSETGAELWSQSINLSVQTSPVVVNGVIYIASEGAGTSEEPQGMLTALNAADGDQLWQQLAPAPLHTTPVVVEDTLVVALTSETALLIGYDLETGSQQWQYLPPQ